MVEGRIVGQLPTRQSTPHGYRRIHLSRAIRSKVSASEAVKVGVGKSAGIAGRVPVGIEQGFLIHW